MKHSFLLTLAVAVSCGFAANRIGPVSQYGQLQAGKNSSGQGRIYGSCPAYSTSGNEVAVQGMSLFWSISSTDGSNFWTADIVKGLVEKHKIQLIRAPMGVDEDWGEGNWSTDRSKYSAYMNTVVQAAIDNDIYVIIDYHSHCAEQSKSTAIDFFTEMAQKWGKYDNVIFEIYNEPKNACNTEPWIDLSGAKNYWTTIRSYANDVISTIRNYSDNLIIVGTPYFDQYPNAALNNPLTANNIAYAFHYYAGEDQYKHTIDNQGANAVKAINGGLSVFVSEWGNSAPSGNGGFNASYSATWYNWMKQNKLSGANWSVSTKAETASYFSGSAWNYSESGNWVNTNVFSALPTSYTACSGTSLSSSSEKPSSSSAKNSSSSVSSSSLAQSSSSSFKESSSSEKPLSSSVQISSSSEALSSSSSEILSSSSVPSSSSNISTDWESNTQLSSASDTGVIIGQSKEYNSERQVSKVLGTLTAGESYTLSFDAFLQNGGSSMEISTVLNSYCSDKVNVNAGETKSYKCQFTASATETATLKLTMPGARWEQVTISNLSLKSSDGKDVTAIASYHSALSLTVSFSAKILEIQSVKPANIDVFDMQGRTIKQISQVNGSVSLESVLPGTYIVRVRSGSENWTRRISIR